MNKQQECPFPAARQVNCALYEMWKRRASRFIFKSDGDRTVVDDGSPDPYRLTIAFDEVRKHLLKPTQRRSLGDIVTGRKIGCTNLRCTMEEGLDVCISILARKNQLECDVFVPLKWKDEKLHNTPSDGTR